jgi:hypothetical protein
MGGLYAVLTMLALVTVATTYAAHITRRAENHYFKN